MQTSNERPESVAAAGDPPASGQRASWATASAPVRTSRSNWRVFAGTMILIAGALNVIDGIIAVFDTHYYVTIEQTTHGPQLVITDSLHTWGWVAFGMGIVMICTAAGIFYATTVGRVIGVIVAGVNLVFQVAFLPVYPIWSLVAILVDTLVIYGLVARYEDTVVEEAPSGGVQRSEAPRADLPRAV